MDFDQYFRTRSELVARVVSEHSEDKGEVNWWPYAASLACIMIATSTHIWASVSLVDPGYFARTSFFLTCIALAGFAPLLVMQIAGSATKHVQIRSATQLREKIAGQILSIDSSLMQRFARQRP